MLQVGQWEECNCYNFVQHFQIKLSAIPIACSSSHSAQNIALNELARQAIMADPVWDNGKYVLRILAKNGHSQNGRTYKLFV